MGHIKDHHLDANFLNTPLEHYHEMATIFGNNTATGQYAKGANDPLAMNVIELEEEEELLHEKGKQHIGVEDVKMSASSSSTKASAKKAKVFNNDKMLTTMNDGIKELAQAIRESATSDI